MTNQTPDEVDIPEDALPPQNVKIPDIDQDYQKILAESQKPLGEIPEVLRPKN